jgi:hypothetical protein
MIRSMNAAHVNLLVGWVGILAGVISGAVIGLFFHREDWAGGYASFRRRMIRLGHISFIGIALLNFAFAVTVSQIALSERATAVASPALIIAAVAMPTVCFLSAWRDIARRLFFIPVGAVFAAVAAVLLGWR